MRLERLIGWSGIRTPPGGVSWQIQFQQSSQDVTLLQGQSANLAPGAYSHVTVYPTAQLTLRAGTYFIDQFDLELQGAIKLDESAGPILLYVRTSLVYRGKVSGGTADKLLVAYLGGVPVTIVESAFNGTLVAPGAPVRLGGTGALHSGAVFAKDLEVDPSVQFTFIGFSSWDQVTFDVVPLLSCVEKRADNTYAALLGYNNPNAKPVTIPIGGQNTFQASPLDRGQPTSFLPGRFASEFSVDFAQTIPMTWQLNGASLAIATSATPCPGNMTTSLAQDTTVALSAPAANFGNSQTLTVGDNSDALVQFDRDQIKKTLGAGRYVVKASLILTQTSGDHPQIEALPMSMRWTELGATWNCANDTDLSATGQICPAGNAWNLDRDDLTQKNPWHVHLASRSIVGAFAAGKLTFDVTRDVWNLLGSEGVRHPAAWALVKQSGSSGAVMLASRESSTAPQLVLTLATRPQTAPKLSLGVDPTLTPAQATVPPLPDGVTRSVAALLAPDSPRTDFVEKELLFDISSDAELPPILARWNGVLVRKILPRANSTTGLTTAVVRIDPSLAQLDALLPRMLEIDNRPLGAHSFSSATGFATVAAAAEELLAGRRVALNWVTRSTSSPPSTSDWADRDISDGPWEPAGIASSPPFSSNAFFWPGLASCDPDPGSPEVPAPCRTTFADHSAIFQYLTVAEAWRALALSGRLTKASVPVSLVDGSFAPSHPDYPTVHAGGLTDFHYQSDKPAHGTKVLLTGYAVVGNGLGAAGPGGPVANVQIEDIPITIDGLIAGLSESQGRVISTSQQATQPALGQVFQSMSTLTQDIRNGGSLLFASAGNDGVDVDAETCFIACWEPTHYGPCEDDGVDCVTGLGFDSNSKDPQSNYGSDTKTIAGPFWTEISDIGLSLVNGVVQPGPTTTAFSVGFNGTSAATPFVAGSASLVVAADPSKSADRIEHCLFEPIRPNSDGAFNTLVPDILASVRCVETGSTAGDVPTFLKILSPADGANIDANQLVNIEATATDYEAGQLTVNWVSDVDHTSSTSTNSDQIGTIQLRTPGIQHLTASAVGSDGLVVSQTITLNVSVSSSSAVIAEPSVDGLTFAQGLEVTLAAAPSISSGLGASLDCSAARWSSTADSGAVDFDGLTGCTIQPTILGAGSHQVVLAYTDPNTGVKSIAKREIEMITVSDFVAQIVSPAKTGAPGFLFDQTITLGAQAINGTNVTYQWSVTVGSETVSIPESTPTVSFAFGSSFTEVCPTQEGQIDLIATNGADGSQSHDSEQFTLSPSIAFETQCIR